MVAKKAFLHAFLTHFCCKTAIVLIANMCFSGSCVRLYTLSGVYAGIDFGKQEWTQDQLTTAVTALHLRLAGTLLNLHQQSG